MGCMRRIALLVVLVVLLAGAWLFRDRLIGMWQSLRSEESTQYVSPELADRAEQKLATMTGPDAPARVTLTSAELQSLVAYRMEESLPRFILDPVVTVDDCVLRVRARVQVAALESTEFLLESTQEPAPVRLETERTGDV